uniref:Transport permease protein n=1 Tax=candidate division WOR-3 bacterium TaxID=2052148 RepID=A0A7V3ZSL6_UNCW3
MFKELFQMKNVIYALFLRELKTRFGKYRLGYLWAILEPFIFISLFVGIRGILTGSLRSGADKFIYHVDYPLFLAAGLIPFFMFRHTVVQIMHSIEANRGLFTYQPVKPIDAIIARWILEGVIFVFVWILVFFILHFIGFKTEIKDPLCLIGIYILFYLFSLGVGMIFCIIVNIYDEVRHIISPFLLFLFFTSGTFFSINMIPSKFQIYLLWNPCLHFIELSRERFFPLYKTEVCSLKFIIICTICVLFLGLVLYKYRIKEILATE